MIARPPRIMAKVMPAMAPLEMLWDEAPEAVAASLEFPPLDKEDVGVDAAAEAVVVKERDERDATDCVDAMDSVDWTDASETAGESVADNEADAGSET